MYRLVKAFDSVSSCNHDSVASHKQGSLPNNHKFTANDVIMLTLQPRGSGDFFGTHTLPNSKDSTSVEARVLNTGPNYIDVALSLGTFEAAFGPAPNNQGPSGKGDPNIRLRADRFFSNIPYMREVAALTMLTSIPAIVPDAASMEKVTIRLDSTIRQLILSTYTFTDPSSPRYQDPTYCDIGNLSRLIAKPPLPNSAALANQAIGLIQSNSRFRNFNTAQLNAIRAALTRRVTLIQGPPGTGKTACAGAIAFGFAHQCRSLSSNTKVLACAFSNVGADNLAEELVNLGLKVVRIGKPSGVSESLWNITLDAAIDRDPIARTALQDAAIATSNLAKGRRAKEDREVAASRRDAATRSVKASIEACRIAATKALRDADVIVCTSVGAADPRLLAACGIPTGEDFDERNQQDRKSSTFSVSRTDSEKAPLAPDGLPSLILPFTIVDEACQSIEPANLIPITSTDSCRSLVLLGDPCQLPPTVKSDVTGTSSLSISLMARLAEILPPVLMSASTEKTECDDTFLNAKSARQAISLIEYRTKTQSSNKITYKKQFPGSILLNVQYRMHPSISAFPSAIFYDSLLSTPSFLGDLRPFPEALHSMYPVENSSLGVRFINVAGQRNERRGDISQAASYLDVPAAISVEASTSFSNKAEAEHVVSILKKLISGSNNPASVPQSIGIVTPYAAQVSLIKAMLDFPDVAELIRFTTIEVKSVDAYQGRERDIIIFSAVRSNRSCRLGFLSDWRRMNVAMTRAKSGLIIVGDKETLKNGDMHWEAFIKWCESSGVISEQGM